MSDRVVVFVGFVTLALVALKLAGVIAWSWLWVFSPVWLPFLAFWFWILFHVWFDRDESARGRE